MSVRAKMMCQSVTVRSEQEEVELTAANGKSGTVNAQWAKWTPGGCLKLTISNPDARGQFKPGAYYFIDITDTDENG